MNPRFLQLLLMALQNLGKSTPSTPKKVQVKRDVGAIPAISSSYSPPTPMRWVNTEYLLKGIFIGLLIYSALTLGAVPFTPKSRPAIQAGVLWFNLSMLIGMILSVVFAVFTRREDLARSRGRFLPFLLFLVLEYPTFIYLGVLLGSLVGLYGMSRVLPQLSSGQDVQLQALFFPVVGGAALAGLVFGWLRQVRNRSVRILLIFLLAGFLSLVGLANLGLLDLSFLSRQQTFSLENPYVFAVQMVLGLPYFYLLTFAGQEEESEVEIGAMMGVLGLSLSILVSGNRQWNSLAFLIPVALFFTYILRVLPGLRVLKHAFRGLSYSRVGKFRKALIAFRRALQLDPTHRLAREGFWDVHRSLDSTLLSQDSQLLNLVDVNLCLDRASSLLLNKPTPGQLTEAGKLLDLVGQLNPSREPDLCYWRAVALTHAGRVQEAGPFIEKILDPVYFGPDNPYRSAILLPAWQLALQLHPELKQKVGLPQLALHGRRIEAISVVENQLQLFSDDESARQMKKFLYQELTERELAFRDECNPLVSPNVDHQYLKFLGSALIEDSSQWERGAEYLRMAARGLPHLGPSLFVQIAQAFQRAGRKKESRQNFELAKRAALGIGWRNLDENQKQSYFSTVKFLAEDSLASENWDDAIENFRLYSEYERSGIETLRTLAVLHERRGDALSAARSTDQGLQYNSKDPDLLDRREKYYISIEPEDLRARLSQFGSGFDVAYCLSRARFILEKYQDAEWLDIARHLCELALVVQPDSRNARFIYARILLRLGQREKAVEELQAVRGTGRPERFSTAEEEDAWNSASQLLGDLFLEMGQAEKAIACLQDFRKSSKSGAKTLYKLGQAFEALGDRAKAIRSYEQVTAYESNPLAYEAREAIDRLKSE
ncbi:MAG: tetratricopeptide repeat protein [Gemmataceae bacterium]